MIDIPLTVLVLTYNEELHLSKCLESVAGLASQIIIVDSGSNDRTKEISQSFNAEFYTNPWPGNQAAQLLWALNNINIKSEWILRLDADEFLLPEIKQEIKETLKLLPTDTTGIFLKRRVYFMNKWIRYGGYYPIKILRLWKKGCGIWEQREMDEHLILTKGSSITLKNDFSEVNLNSISWWISKHNNYASREAAEYFKTTTGLVKGKLGQSQEKRKRWYKNNLYNKMPLLVRPFLYFIYRYVFLLGFLDGKQGFIWHFMQGLWYRLLVDVKIIEIKMKQRNLDAQ